MSSINFVVGMIFFHLAVCGARLKDRCLCGRTGYTQCAKESQCWHCQVCKALDGE